VISKQQQTMPRTIEFTDILFGTWNVRSMYRTGVMTTIVSCLERYKLDITAVQEVRWDGAGSLKTQEMTIFYSGGENHVRGVGFVIKNSILPNVVRFEPINDRICYVELKGKWFNIILINCYAPTEEKSEEIKNAFYEELDRIYDALPTGKPKIIVDDFNAKIGKEETYTPTIGKDSLHNDTNDNGNKLITFATARNMRISSTMFPHKNIHKQTWISPCGKVRNQIDHVMVDYRIRSSINDVRSMRGSSAVSDHFLVRAKVKFRISVERSKIMKCTKKY